MERNFTIHHYLETMDKSIVKKCVQFSFTSYLFLFLGITLLYYSINVAEENKNILDTFLIIMSIFLILLGFLFGMNEKHYFKHIKSKTKIVFYELYFEEWDFQELSNIIDTCSFSALHYLQTSVYHNVKLNIACSLDKSFCIIQGVKQVPLTLMS